MKWLTHIFRYSFLLHALVNKWLLFIWSIIYVNWKSNENTSVYNSFFLVDKTSSPSAPCSSPSPAFDHNTWSSSADEVAHFHFCIHAVLKLEIESSLLKKKPLKYYIIILDYFIWILLTALVTFYTLMGSFTVFALYVTLYSVLFHQSDSIYKAEILFQVCVILICDKNVSVNNQYVKMTFRR